MTNPSFGTWLQNELDQRELSPADLARLSGISPSQITRVLRGERGMRDETLVSIAKALKMPPEQVFKAAIGQTSKSANDWVDGIDYKIKQIKSPAARRAIERMIDGFMTDEESEQQPNRKTKPKPAGT